MLGVGLGVAAGLGLPLPALPPTFVTRRKSRSPLLRMDTHPLVFKNALGCTLSLGNRSRRAPSRGFPQHPAPAGRPRALPRRSSRSDRRLLGKGSDWETVGS